MITVPKPSCCSRYACPVSAIIHLPAAPQVVARTRFSPPPPGRGSSIAVPEVMAMLDRAMTAGGDGITMAAISGPGDPLATADLTLELLQQIRLHYPQLKIGLRTMGIGSAALAADLARNGVHYIEMQVDGIRAEILEQIYAWIRPAAKTLKIGEAVDLLIREQRNGVPALVFNGITVAIRTTLYPGCNVDHVAAISMEMMELGADSISLIPYSPEVDAEVRLDPTSPEMVVGAAARAAPHLTVVEPLLGRTPPVDVPSGGGGPRPTKRRPNVAVASSNGIDVDLHLGEAINFLVYGPRADGLTCLLDRRQAPEPGTGPLRWRKVADLLDDCCALLAASAGEAPRRILTEAGLPLLITKDHIDGLVDVLYGGGKKGGKGKTVASDPGQ